MMRKRRFAYGAWLLFAILLYFFENNTGTRTILAASVFLPAASVLCAVRSARRVTVHLSAPDCCKQGDAAECSVRAEGLLPGAVLTAVLRGRSRLAGEKTAVKLSASQFAPDAAGTLRTAHCGTVILSLSNAAVQDWFGLYRCALTVQSTRFVTVEPPLFDVRITLAENETVTADSERWSSTHPGHDPSETFGFRTYVPGDPIRQIHWKLSQKTDSLMVRELGLSVAEEVLLLLDPPASDELDRAREWVSQQLARRLGEAGKAGITPERLVAVAGTATTVVAVRDQMRVYDSAKVHKALVTRQQLDRQYAELAAMPLEQRSQVVGLDPGRAPVIVAGLVIMQAVMDAVGVDGFTVSETDILHGIILDAAKLG